MYFHLTKRAQTAKTVELCAEMSAIDGAAAELCAGLNEEQLSWFPRPGSWSIAQNLAHLRTTTCVFLPAVDLALEESKTRRLYSEGPFRLNLYGHLLVRRMESRSIIKMQAPKPLRPQLINSPAEELEHFLIAQAAMRRRIEDAEGLDLAALRFPSPLARYLHLNLLEFFSVFNAHSRRHIRQANKVRNALLRPNHGPLPAARWER
jgi:hypothetical protein